MGDDMTDRPEMPARIYAERREGSDVVLDAGIWAEIHTAKDATPYVRADLVAEAVEKLEQFFDLFAKPKGPTIGDLSDAEAALAKLKEAGL
jgi:porphobilinogen deaminase